MPLLAQNGALLRDALGKLTQCASDCCGATTICGGCNPAPQALQVQFSGITLAGCQDGSDLPDQCLVSTNYGISVDGDPNVTIFLALDPNQVSGAQFCRFFGYFPGLVAVSSMAQGCGGPAFTSIAWLHVEASWSNVGVSLSARAMVHGAAVLWPAGIAEGPLIFSGSATNQLGDCGKTISVANDFVAPSHFLFGGPAGWGGAAIVSPAAGGATGDQVSPVSCPAACASCPATIMAVVSGHSDPLVNGTYTLARSGCSWIGSNSGGVQMIVTCETGVWTARISGACPGSGGQVFFNESALNWPCPPASGWQRCLACELAGENVAMSIV